MLVSGPTKRRIHAVLSFAVFWSLVVPVTAQPVKLSIKETLEKVAGNLPQLEAYRQQAAAAKEHCFSPKQSGARSYCRLPGEHGYL